MFLGFFVLDNIELCIKSRCWKYSVIFFVGPSNICGPKAQCLLCLLDNTALSAPRDSNGSHLTKLLHVFRQIKSNLCPSNSWMGLICWKFEAAFKIVYSYIYCSAKSFITMCNISITQASLVSYGHQWWE